MDESTTKLANLSKNVRAARETSGLSQRDFVRHLNKEGADTNQAALARLEAGRREPRLNEVIALAKVLYVEVEALTWEPEAFSRMMEGRPSIGRYSRSGKALNDAVVEHEAARKELLEEIQEYGAGWPAGMRGFLRRDASIRSDEVVKKLLYHLDKHENR